MRSFQTLENQLAVADASVNISFMLLHEDNLPEALRFAELGVVHDPHDPNALVNKGCVFMKMGDDASLQNAMACFDAALRVDETCVQVRILFPNPDTLFARTRLTLSYIGIRRSSTSVSRTSAFKTSATRLAISVRFF